MKEFFSVTLRQDFSHFRDIARNQSYLFNIHDEGHIPIRNDSKIPQSVTGGQGKAIQRKFLVRH